ncbi:unnamed protein product [Oikopleura dioica]|uniref:Uncharacterized protein n=1 Tax=Oikopleura dioica TaxID=34765 RepID=E4XJF7_OIKDI|nr:unnamed protein product [Oikopleura dioica]CBY38903.1 unnamed protein product [Oikopleura dioica]
MAYNRDRDRLFEYQDPNRGSFNSFQKETALDMEGAQFDRLGSANRNMDNILDSAESSLAGLVGQREQLKGVKQKMLNIANQLGMSQTVIRLIGKRADQDRLILWGGMFVTSLIMFIIWKFYM